MADLDHTSADFLETQRQALLAFSKTFPFFRLLGMELLEVDPGRAKISVTWRDDLCQPAGVMHGGVIASVVDTCIAHSMLLTKPYLEAKAKGGGLVSVDLRIKYLRPVSSGTIFCEARSPRVGRQITHATAVVTDASGKEVATGDSIYMIVTADQLRPCPVRHPQLGGAGAILGVTGQ